MEGNREMREILFRGKRVDNGEWIRGDLITTPFIRNETQQNIIYILDITKADYDCFEDLTEDNGIFEVDPSTVCQYTGLTDKNGRRFEGDIFQASDGDYIQRYIITWNEDSLEWSAECIGDPDGTLPLSEFKVGEIEVIGNIFDNPELTGDQP